MQPSSTEPSFSEFDAAAETERIVGFIREAVMRTLRRRGAVVAVSGGIDSSVVAALCVRALGAQRVYGLMLPEEESSVETTVLGRLLLDHLAIPWAHEDITQALRGARCYERRDEALRRVIPEFGEGYKCKIVLPSIVETEQLRVFSAVVKTPDGRELRARLNPEAQLGVVASTNFKQRTRKMFEYHYADLLGYAVAGTPNKLEHELGFFVKNGDGAADFKPIAHLYKTQVYQLARYLGLPTELVSRPPTTDTYSLPQTQEEFFFSLPYEQMDLCLYAHDRGIDASVVAKSIGLRSTQVDRVYADIDAKRRAAEYLHAPALMIER